MHSVYYTLCTKYIHIVNVDEKEPLRPFKTPIMTENTQNVDLGDIRSWRFLWSCTKTYHLVTCVMRCLRNGYYSQIN